MSWSNVPGTSFRTTAAGPYNVRSLIHACVHSCEKPSDVARRNRRCAATHSGASNSKSKLRLFDVPSCESTRGCLAASLNPSRVLVHVPAPSTCPYRTLHVFQRTSKSSSGTNPYLCPYHSMSICKW